MNKTLLERNARQVLDQAITAEIGVEVHVSSPNLIQAATRGKQVLYRFKNADGAFQSLQIRYSPDDMNNRLWIIRTDTGLIAPPPSVIDFDDIVIDL